MKTGAGAAATPEAAGRAFLERDWSQPLQRRCADSGVSHDARTSGAGDCLLA